MVATAFWLKEPGRVVLTPSKYCHEVVKVTDIRGPAYTHDVEDSWQRSPVLTSFAQRILGL
jgi:hypothetical protein